MENRDFRDRLKNHKRKVNPAAWDQMEGLLDSLPNTKKEDKRKKRGFWLFFFGIGIILFLGITGLLLFPFDNSKLSDQLDNQSTNELTTDSANSEFINLNTNNDQKGVLSSDDSANEIKSSFENETPIVEESTKLNSSSTQSNDHHNKVETLSFENNVNSDSKRNATNEVLDKRSINNLENSVSSDSKEDGSTKKEVPNPTLSIEDNSNPSTEIKKEGSPEKIDEILSEEKDVNIENKTSLGDPESSGLSNGESDDEVRTDLLTLDKLFLPFSSILTNEEMEQMQSPSIRIVKPSKFSWFLGGGYALFNSNPGYIIQTGTSFDLDRILDLEGNLSYSYGSEQNIPAGELFTYERQFDISMIVHFNMIENRQHKLSFMAGIGYTMYGGQRIIRSEPIQVDDRRHNGRNLQLGFNYQFTINKKSAIGLRFGAISFDDAVTYIAPRYIYSF